MGDAILNNDSVYADGRHMQKQRDDFPKVGTRYEHKSSQEMNADVLKLRDVNAKPATEFTLASYGSRKQVSLSEFKRQVVLLNFWFPECGPCHEEFPHLKAVANKYKGRGLSAIAVNIVPEQNDLVVSSLRGYGLDFIPAQGDEKIRTAYGVRGVPDNFVIGPDGRIWFHPSFPITDQPSNVLWSFKSSRCLNRRITIRQPIIDTGEGRVLRSKPALV